MLSRLHIQNYAIIEELEIRFSGKLNIITGETGAGKSILMGALNLILGERADTSVLKLATKKCVVEGSFDVTGNKLVKEFLSRFDSDEEDEVILRREIGVNGKSRGFINDTPANLSQLKELAVLLVDLHQQFDTLDLGSETFQRNVLDAFAGNLEDVQSLNLLYQQYAQIYREAERKKQLQAEANKELDYHTFQFNELDGLGLKEDELEILDAELQLLNNAENIKGQLSGICDEMKDSEQPVIQRLKVILLKFPSFSGYHPALPLLEQRLNSAFIELKDVADELEQINESIQYNAERISIINDRLSEGYKLQKKHGVNTTAALLEIAKELSARIEAVLHADSEIGELEVEAARLKSKAMAIAEKISIKRKEAAPILSGKVNLLLRQVGMPNARLQVTVTGGQLTLDGIDSIAFLFDANKSDRFEHLGKVASGGELSRVMLSIKSLVARKLLLPTLIFDEIDTGISGEAARQVGEIMKSLSAEHQVISITHQPQIAARADSHYFVFKEIRDDKVITSIRLLTSDERITAIAQMLGGERPTAAALENAREMVGN